MSAREESPGAIGITFRVQRGWLEFRMGRSLIYDIELKEFREPNKAAGWWRQLAGKAWFTGSMNKWVSEAVSKSLQIS